MIASMVRWLADRLGVQPPRVGEEITPQIRFEQPWPQWLALLIGLGGIALIVGVYRREGSASMPSRMLLAALRCSLVLLAMLMLSEAVLSVERTGLPYFLVLMDDSASGQIVDPYADPKVREAAADLAKAAGQSEASRLAIAQGFLAREDGKLIRELQPNHKVKLYLVSNSARPLAEIDRPDDVTAAIEKVLKVEATGAETKLGDGVEQVLAEMRGAMPSAILLLSDGQTTDGEALAQAAEVARRKGVPLYTIGLGDAEPARDIELADLQVDDVVFADDLVKFQARLTSRGFEGQRLTARLLEMPKDSKDRAQAREIARVEVDAPPDGKAGKVEINHRPKETGEVTFILEVGEQPREIRTDNNRIVRTVSVRKEKLKVLLADGEPRYEFRYLKEFLRREETTEVKVILQSASPEFATQDLTALATFPSSKEEIFAFDVIVFGDVDISLLSTTQLEAIAEFVTEKGGGLLFVAGSGFNPSSYRGTPLEPLLPIQLADSRNPTAVGNAVAPFRPQLTLEGRVHPIFRFGDDEASSGLIWQDLPEQHWYFEAPRKQPAAFVLAEHPAAAGRNGNLPLIVYQFLGSGKTMFHAIDDTWLWRRRVGDRYFGRFWLQTVRFLARSRIAGSKGAEITTDRLRYQRQQPVPIRVRFLNPGLAPPADQLAAEVSNPTQQSRKVELKKQPGAAGLFEGVLPPSREGEYTVKLLPPPALEGGMPTTQFHVDPPAGEFERVQMNAPELARAAELTGGKFYTPTTAEALPRDLPRPQKVPLDTDPPIVLWNTWPALGLFLALLTAEWILRKRKQLV
ncbi:MAG: VWA domain-containing protein [Isosphaeraceae bacterium]